MDRYIKDGLVFKAIQLNEENFSCVFESIQELGYIADFDDNTIFITNDFETTELNIGDFLVMRKYLIWSVDEIDFFDEYEKIEN